jgi:hypothetical protein
MSNQQFLANEYMLASYCEVTPWLTENVKELFERELTRHPPEEPLF